MKNDFDRRKIDFRVANIMQYNPRAEGPWDLVVMTETIYCLGWLYGDEETNDSYR